MSELNINLKIEKYMTTYDEVEYIPYTMYG